MEVRISKWSENEWWWRLEMFIERALIHMSIVLFHVVSPVRPAVHLSCLAKTCWLAVKGVWESKNCISDQFGWPWLLFKVIVVYEIKNWCPNKSYWFRWNSVHCHSLLTCWSSWQICFAVVIFKGDNYADRIFKKVELYVHNHVSGHF